MPLFQEGQGRENRRNKALLVVLDPATDEAAALDDNLPGIGFPERALALGDDVEMCHYPETGPIILARNRRDEIGADPGSHTAVRRVHADYIDQAGGL